MSTQTSVGRSGLGWGVASAAALAFLFVLLLCALSSAGCASEADLVRVLSTDQDADVRREAARDLAQKRSVDSTRELVAAAAGDRTAAAGLKALAEEYGVVLDKMVHEALDSAKQEGNGARSLRSGMELAPIWGKYQLGPGELSYDAGDSDKDAPREKALARMGELVDCLACMGIHKALEVLETFAGVDGQKVSGMREVQVRAIRAMGAHWSAEALDEFIRLGGAFGETSYYGAFHTAVAVELRKIGKPAVAPLLKAAASEDWARGVLGTMGADAISELIEVLGSQKWAEAALAEIGSPAIEAVLEELSSPEPNVAHRALGVLLRMFDAWEPGIEAILLTDEMVPVLLSDLANVAFVPENTATKADGFDHEFMAWYALTEIGSSAIGAIVASDYDYSWLIVEMMGAEAVPSLMSMMTGQDRDYSLAAAVTLARMKFSSPPAVASLTEAMAQKQLEYIATNYLYYLALGEPDSDWVIAEALLRYGDKQMGLDCLNCGNAVLDEAARKWGSRHGYIVYENSGPVSAMPWGFSGASTGADGSLPM